MERAAKGELEDTKDKIRRGQQSVERAAKGVSRLGFCKEEDDAAQRKKRIDFFDFIVYTINIGG